jgi:Putative transposase
VTTSIAGSSIAYRLGPRWQPHRRPAWGGEQPGEQRRGEDGTDRRPARAYLPRSGYCGRGWLHPHLHCVVPGGGISPDGERWIGCKKKSFFLPVKVLSSRFRRLFLIYLRKAFLQGRLRFHGAMADLAQPAAFEALCQQAGRIKWVVFVKPPFGGPEQVLKYLARYTHRVAISNRRLLSMEDGRVTFEYKDYADGNQTKILTLEATEFIRRFLLHILPSGFVRIRQFGFLANRARGKKLALCRALLGATPPAISSRTEPQEAKRCPTCKIGRMILIGITSHPHPDSS